VVVVPWAQTVAEHPEWLGHDGVHPNDTGYRVRAQLYAQAARSCG
jgi:lysophospholipase L1-like esterase